MTPELNVSPFIFSQAPFDMRLRSSLLMQRVILAVKKGPNPAICKNTPVKNQPTLIQNNTEFSPFLLLSYAFYNGVVPVNTINTQ